MDRRIHPGREENDGAQGVLDLEYLARCSHGDRALESELLTLYMEQARQQLLLVSGARDPASLARALHTLKGAALALGIRSVASAAERLEKAGFDRACEADMAMLAALASDVAAAEKCIRRHLARAA